MGDSNKHALLSASSSHRWLMCPPSAVLCSKYEDTNSEFAMEGTDAHTLAQYKLEKLLGIDTKDPTKELTFYDQSMDDYATDYAGFVYDELEKIKENCKDPKVLIEQKLDFSKFVPEGFGFVDCLIVADGTLTVIDFKYGLGVEVKATDNSQMKLYAIGGIELFDGIYDIQNVHMIIYQPRKNNISDFSISKNDLYTWAENTLKPTALLAYEGKGEYKAGEHCQFCKAKATCKTRADKNLELASYDFRPANDLTIDEISDILKKIDSLTSWASDVKEYALAQALKGTKFKGYKVVAGKSNRKYLDELKVANAVIKEGFDPYEKKLLGITDMTTLLGKKKFETILGDLVIKPEGKPTLVEESDKRPEINCIKNEFDK